MAIGKCEKEQEINPERVVISFDQVKVYPNSLNAQNLEELRQIMSKDQVDIHVSLNIGEGLCNCMGLRSFGGLYRN